MSFLRLAAAILMTAVFASCGTEGVPGVPDDGERRNEASEWYLRSIAPDELTISIVYTMSGVASDCQREGPAVAQESPTSVNVIAYRSVTLDRDRPCTEELAYVEKSVRLRDPLGDRALVGCRPPRTQPSEDRVCRDLQRSREAGIFEFSPP